MNRRFGFTMIELCVVMACIGILTALLLSALQGAREAGRRITCQNNLRQLSLACISFHDMHRQFPTGTKIEMKPRAQGWFTGILPYIEANNEFALIEEDIRVNANLFDHSAHPFITLPIRQFQCVNDPRVSTPQQSKKYQKLYAFTSYLGVSGTNSIRKEGMLYGDSRTNYSMVTDGSSNTLLIGERPPSNWFDVGWWYAGVGFDKQSGIGEHTLGIHESHREMVSGHKCPEVPEGFVSDIPTHPCSDRHFWSMHVGGANFARADGSVQFFSFGTTQILLALATRDGGESNPQTD